MPVPYTLSFGKLAVFCRCRSVESFYNLVPDGNLAFGRSSAVRIFCSTQMAVTYTPIPYLGLQFFSPVLLGCDYSCLPITSLGIRYR